jgi:hypothetical protein
MTGGGTGVQARGPGQGQEAPDPQPECLSQGAAPADSQVPVILTGKFSSSTCPKVLEVLEIPIILQITHVQKFLPGGTQIFKILLDTGSSSQGLESSHVTISSSLQVL